MDFDFNLSPSDANPETMDLLSRAWCSFAVQSLQSESQEGSLLIVGNLMKQSEGSTKVHPSNMEKSAGTDDADFKSFPQWKSNDVKSWIRMQQAMHPELNYNSCFRKKWMPWKQIIPLKAVSIKKWFKDIKQRRKEEDRLQRAEVHAAISVAGVAAALAAIAAENSKKESDVADKEAAVASAATLVAAQCAKVAEAMGARKEQLSSVIGSAMSSTNPSDIFTLTASAATSLRGAATLKSRAGCKNRLDGRVPILPIENEDDDKDFDFEKGRSILAEGVKLYVKTPEGTCMVRSVSVVLNSEAKVVVIMKKHNLLKSKKESIVLNLHGELHKESEAEDANTCYLVVLTTNRGTVKLDMGDDCHPYKIWTKTINHMLVLSNSFTK